MPGRPEGCFAQKVPDTFLPHRGFTLIELMVVVAIIAILLVITGAAWRSITQSSTEDKAINAVSTYAAVARNYAMRHQLETILTIEPKTGQLDMFVWDTVGDASIPEPPNARYIHVPVLDDSAKLPIKGGVPAVQIAPIDHAEQRYNDPPAGDRRDGRNLSVLTLCFNPQGQLVERAFEVLYTLPPADPNSRMIAMRRILFALPSDPDEPNGWRYLESTRGGVAYEPASPLENVGDPNAVVRAMSQTPFMFNTYTGRVVEEVTP